MVVGVEESENAPAAVARRRMDARVFIGFVIQKNINTTCAMTGKKGSTIVRTKVPNVRVWSIIFLEAADDDGGKANDEGA